VIDRDLGADRRFTHSNTVGTALELRSNTGMTPAPDIEQRLTDLEIKASFTEDLVEDLNQTIFRQQQQIDALLREVGLLREQSANLDTGGFRSLRDELPPHY
jgi:SlyX protein